MRRLLPTRGFAILDLLLALALCAWILPRFAIQLQLDLGFLKNAERQHEESLTLESIAPLIAKELATHHCSIPSQDIANFNQNKIHFSCRKVAGTLASLCLAQCEVQILNAALPETIRTIFLRLWSQQH